MSKKFVYVIYVRTTPHKLWDALTKPEFTCAYWANTRQDCDCKEGSPWRLMIPDGRIGDSGEVLEVNPARRLVLSWRNEFIPQLTSEDHSRATLEPNSAGDVVRLTVTHGMDREDSRFIEAVSNGWPHILSSLKSLLETGHALPGSD